ncbi:MAG TPA: hypothetical protein VIW93_08835 [Candidatus Acidoferrum sp.]
MTLSVRYVGLNDGDRDLENAAGSRETCVTLRDIERQGAHTSNDTL